MHKKIIIIVLLKKIKGPKCFKNIPLSFLSAKGSVCEFDWVFIASNFTSVCSVYMLGENVPRTHINSQTYIISPKL